LVGVVDEVDDSLIPIFPTRASGFVIAAAGNEQAQEEG
jgi:hypothetical protein